MNGIQSCLIEGCDAIETIVESTKLGSILKGPLQPGSLTKLKTLVLTGCQTLVKVFPPGSIQYLCEIQCLEIEKCDEIEEVISESDAHGNLRVLPKLKKMFLQDMRNLSSICAIETLEWPSLEELKILNCPGLSILLCIIKRTKNDFRNYVSSGNVTF
ncbi:hypothetical protein C3L33_21296, partial [Rhododendron williamsianum]